MGYFELDNGEITARIASFGAELQSLKDAGSGREYMWSGDPAYWKRVSPVLFPLVGNYKNKKTSFGGQEYVMSQHGFARDREFTRISGTDTEIWLALDSDEETRKSYPFDFRLELGYRLKDRTLEVLWRVKNTDSRKIWFSIGGHPAFACPLNEEGNKDGYALQFDTAGPVETRIIGPDGLATDEHEEYLLENGRLPVKEALFDRDALVLEGGQAHSLGLVDPKGNTFVTVRFDAPLFGIWSPPGKNAPFICVEPWYGRCDHRDFNGTLEEREWSNSLEAGGEFNASYSISV